jgi:8-oxo-dGTP pyrophosphatase MutT (NUDIX family)
VRFDHPPPGEEINEGPVTEPRQAATLMLLRDGKEGLEVLLVQRNPEQRFMGGAWVFPGGALHDEDTDLAAAAVREMAEEAEVTIEAEALALFSRWITPAEVKVRFDTWFYVARSPEGAEPRVDGQECVDVRWVRPSDALEAGRRDEMMLVFPTIKHLERLDQFGSVAAALENAEGRSVDAVQPRIVSRDGMPEVLLPGEPGYDEA